MFKKLCALLLALPLISALQLNPPTSQVYSSSPITVTWSTSSGDPGNFDLYLTNSIFRNTFALKNNALASDGTITLTLPVVPAGDGYTFQASPVGNVNSVLSQTTTFNIADALSSTSSSTLSSSGTGVSSLSTPASSGLSSSPRATPPTGTSSSSSSSTVVPTGSFNGNSNGALSVTGVGAAVVGVLVAAGAFFAY